MQAGVWQGQYFNSYGKHPKIYTDSSGQDLGFKRYAVKVFFIRSISPSTAQGNCIRSEAVGRAIPTVPPNLASSSVRIFFGERSKHPPSLSLLHFRDALKLWLHGIYILIGGTPEVRYTYLWEHMHFTSIAGTTFPYLSKFSSSSFFRFGGRPRLLPVFPGTFGVFVCPPHPLRNSKTTMKYLLSKGTAAVRMREGQGNWNSC